MNINFIENNMLSRNFKYFKEEFILRLASSCRAPRYKPEGRGFYSL